MKNIQLRLTMLSLTVACFLSQTTTSLAAPELSFAITPAGPGGTATASVGLGDVSDVESFSLLLDFGNGTALQLPTTSWFKRGAFIPVSPFGATPTVELNSVFESSARNKVFFDAFKPAGAVGAVGSVAFQVNPAAVLGSGHQVVLSGEYFSKSTQKVVTIRPLTTTFTVTNVPSHLLSVTLAGTGGGAVNSDPSGIACTGGTCQASFTQNSVVTLMASPDSNSTFDSWSACAGTGNCSVTMTADKSVTAVFTQSPFIKVLGSAPSYFSLLQNAVNAAGTNLTLQARTSTFAEQVVFNRAGVSVKLKGGYDSSFTSQSGRTTIDGKLLLRSGTLRVESLAVQ